MYRYLAFILLLATANTYANDCLNLKENECHNNSSCIPINYKSCCGSQEFGCFENGLNKCNYTVRCYRSSKSLDVIEASNDCFIPPAGYELFVPINKCSDEKLNECTSKGKQCIFKKNTCSNPTSCCQGKFICEGEDQDEGISQNVVASRSIDPCSNVICQEGENCQIDSDGFAHCYVTPSATMGGIFDVCLGVRCQDGQHCETDPATGKAHCVLNINPIGFTTTGPSSTVACGSGSSTTLGGSSTSTTSPWNLCEQVQCQSNQHCEIDPNTGNAHCVVNINPIGFTTTGPSSTVAGGSGSSTTLGGSSTSTTGPWNLCDQVQCQDGQHCEIDQNTGNAHCVLNINPIGFTTTGPSSTVAGSSTTTGGWSTSGSTSTTTGWDPCSNVICPEGQNCQIDSNGFAHCFVTPSATMGGIFDVCLGVRCQDGQHCETDPATGKARCVLNITPL